MAARRLSGVHRRRRFGAGAPRVAGRDRRDSRHSREGANVTLSIAARCRETGMVGAAVCSSSIAVASRCAHVRARVGAALTQNVTDPALGPMALDYLDAGMSAPDVLRLLVQEEQAMAWRQIVLVPARGVPAVFSGERALGVIGGAIGVDCAAAGNLLASPSVA